MTRQSSSSISRRSSSAPLSPFLSISRFPPSNPALTNFPISIFDLLAQLLSRSPYSLPIPGFPTDAPCSLPPRITINPSSPLLLPDFRFHSSLCDPPLSGPRKFRPQAQSNFSLPLTWICPRVWSNSLLNSVEFTLVPHPTQCPADFFLMPYRIPVHPLIAPQFLPTTPPFPSPTPVLLYPMNSTLPIPVAPQFLPATPPFPSLTAVLPNPVTPEPSHPDAPLQFPTRDLTLSPLIALLLSPLRIPQRLTKFSSRTTVPSSPPSALVFFTQPPSSRPPVVVSNAPAKTTPTPCPCFSSP